MLAALLGTAVNHVLAEAFLSALFMKVNACAGGYFARDPSVLRRVGDVILDPSQRSSGTLSRWLVGKDAFDLAGEASRHALYQVRPGCLSISRSCT